MAPNPRVISHRPVRLCSIYLRDLISLSTRGEVEQLGQVSHYFNSTVTSLPSDRLPRYYFFAFGLFKNAVNSDEDEEGTPIGVQLRGGIFGRGRQREIECCTGLKVGMFSCCVWIVSFHCLHCPLN
jgi:hypothetical protein